MTISKRILNEYRDPNFSLYRDYESNYYDEDNIYVKLGYIPDFGSNAQPGKYWAVIQVEEPDGSSTEFFIDEEETPDHPKSLNEVQALLDSIYNDLRHPADSDDVARILSKYGTWLS